MFKFTTAFLLLAFILHPGVSTAASDSERLEDLSNRYVDSYRPGAHAGARDDHSAAAFKQDIRQKEKELEELLTIESEGLSLEQDIDRRLLIGIARSDINTARAQRRWENDAALYLPSAGLAQLFEPEYAGTSEERKQALFSMLGTLPAALEHGQANLQNPPEFFTLDAIYQAKGSIKTLQDGMAALGDVPKELAETAEKAEKALGKYLAFLENELLPRSEGDWALGLQAYNFILQNRWHMDTDAEQIRQRGLRAFDETEKLAQQVAERLQPGKHWTEVYESLKDDHPAANEIKQAYQQQMDAAQVFVLEHGILELPEEERVITLDTPPAMRRSSPFGTFEQVSPFDGGLEGRLYLTPIEEGLPPDQQEQRLRSHHNAWVPVIAVHEAYPGHHAQALIVNQNPKLLRRVISEPIFSEGWGLFTEEFMYEQGFLQGDAVRLTQLRNRLWRAARVILDSGLHTGQISFDEAVQFLVEKVRFEPYAAGLEVGMYVRNPTYVLGYLIGMQEIEKIRAEYIARYGEPEPLSLFYNRLLKIGAIPPALLREELFRDQ